MEVGSDVLRFKRVQNILGKVLEQPAVLSFCLKTKHHSWFSIADLTTLNYSIKMSYVTFVFFNRITNQCSLRCDIIVT